MEMFILLIAAVGVIAIIASGSSVGPATKEFKSRASRVDRAVATSATKIDWNSRSISELLPRDSEDNSLRPRITEVEYDTRGTILSFGFPTGFGAADWVKVWPRVESYLAGDGVAEQIEVRRSGAKVLIVSRDGLEGNRGATWL